MRLALIAAVLLCGTAAFVSPARACDCAMLGPRSFLAPANGATAVPTNAKIWLGMMEVGANPFGGVSADGGTEITFEIIDAQGGSVEFARTGLGTQADFLTVLSPKAPLAADAEYRVNVNGSTVTRFTTGAEADTTAPAVPEAKNLVLSGRSGTGFDCGAEANARFDVDFQGGLVAVLDVGGAAEVEPEGPRGPAAIVTGSPVMIGHDGCLSFAWNFAAPGAATTLLLGMFDLSGNFSGWSGRQVIVLPDEGVGCGCTSPGAGAFAVLALALGFVRRRIRR